ncbi:class IIb bacteriocin, lactobin A/cerein 7B family [Thalassotalea crassostreae]|nr:class IIb bacteriocin, lactobin A/cerein 7B family [Thalassotalea crassostreae]
MKVLNINEVHHVSGGIVPVIIGVGIAIDIYLYGFMKGIERGLAEG